MRKILLTITLVAFATFSFSQQVSRYVVASGGDYSTASGISVSSTIGESMVTTLTSASNVLTQGFQQSFSAPVDPSITITNPMDGSIHYCLDNPTIGYVVSNFTVGLPSSGGDGHIHYSVNGSAGPMQYDTTHIQLTNLANGSYQFIIELVDNSHSSFSPVISDTVNFTINIILGCMDSTATNYDPLATCDDGSCTSPAVCGAITGVNLTDIIHDRATFNWDDMNSATCDVDQIRIRYSDDNGATYSTKTMGAPVGNNAPALNTSKRILNLSASTTYVYDFKIWYQDGTVVSWHAGGLFTTAAICDNVTNVTVTPLNNVLKADFCWTAPSTPYSFVRLKYREDVAGSSFSNIGGMGVMSPTLCKEKGGLTPGTNYRVMWRTWCNPSGGPYRSPQWDGPVLWTQPTSIRVDELSSINSLEVYPNPSRDVFNVEFTSETKQTIEVRLVNLVGEIIFTENLENFEGDYTHSFNLEQYSKGIYLLELDTDNGIVNKKLILQ